MRRITRTKWAVALAIGALATAASVASAAPVSVEPGNAVATQFPQSLQCVCHGMLVSEWQQAMHSKALDDPLFKTKVAEADAATHGKFGTFCRRCHAPVANMTAQDGMADMSPAAAQGVVCSFCHQVTRVSAPIGNVSQLLELNGVMRAQLKDAHAPHFTRYSALHESSRLCGGCHDLKHPGNGVALLSTYSEWKKSPQARKGLQCQDCHMSESPPLVGPSTGFAAESASQRDNIYHMTFAGAQVALGNGARATALLQSAAEVEIEAPDVIAGDSPAQIVVKVTNEGAGHYLPTGVTELRQMWLSVVLVDDRGTETEVGRRVFGTEFKDSNGKHPVEIQYAVGIAKDDRIPPTESVTATYGVVLPAGVESADLRARLLYQSVPDELATRAGVKNPTTTMAEAVKRVFASQEAKAADTGGSGSTEASAGAASATALWKPLVICGGLLVVAGVLGTAAMLRIRKRDAS